MAALENTGRRYVKSNMYMYVCLYATTIVHGTVQTLLRVAIEMQIAFFLDHCEIALFIRH